MTKFIILLAMLLILAISGTIIYENSYDSNGYITSLGCKFNPRCSDPISFNKNIDMKKFYRTQAFCNNKNFMKSIVLNDEEKTDLKEVCGFILNIKEKEYRNYILEIKKYQ